MRTEKEIIDKRISRLRAKIKSLKRIRVKKNFIKTIRKHNPTLVEAMKYTYSVKVNNKVGGYFSGRINVPMCFLNRKVKLRVVK